jgi:hypothetical protein
MLVEFPREVNAVTCELIIIVYFFVTQFDLPFVKPTLPFMKTTRVGIAQLVSVLEYLHCELPVAHHDLGCENVLLDGCNNISSPT